MRKACFLAVAAGLAQVSFAQVNITQTFPIDAPILENLTATRQSFSGADLFINGFNPALGTLKAITVTAYGNMVVYTPVENTSPALIGGDLTVRSKVIAAITVPDGMGGSVQLNAVRLEGSDTRVIASPPFSDRIFSNRRELYGTVRITNTPANAAFFRHFTSPGQVVLSVIQTNDHELPAGTRVSRDIPPVFGLYGRFRGTIRVTYTYNP